VDGGLAPVGDTELLAAGVEEWTHLPMWVRAEQAATLWDVDTTRARRLGPPVRPVRDSVADVRAWMQSAERPTPPPGRELPGLPPELEAGLLAGR